MLCLFHLDDLTLHLSTVCLFCPYIPGLTERIYKKKNTSSKKHFYSNSQKVYLMYLYT